MDFDFKKVLFSHKDKTSVDKGVSIDVFTSGCFQPSDATELTRLFSISASLSPLLKSRGPLFKSLGFTEYAFECSQSYHMIFFSWFYHCLPSNVICHETGRIKYRMQFAMVFIHTVPSFWRFSPCVLWHLVSW